MGCGCGGKKNGSGAVAATSRQTVYQVINPADNSVISEFKTLPEARSEAVAKQGRVRVTSKTV